MSALKQSHQWFDSLLFYRIFQTFRIAIQPTKLIIAFLALTIICLAGWLMDFSRSVVVTPDTTELQIYLSHPDTVQSYIEEYRQERNRIGVFSSLWRFISLKYHDTLKALFDLNFTAVAYNLEQCYIALEWAMKFHPLYCVIFFAIVLAVMSVSGGAICRMSALQFAQGEKPGLTEALHFGIRKFPGFFAAPLIPAGMVICSGLFISLIGLLGNIPRIGELVLALLLLLALLAGVFIAFVAIGGGAGFNLMFPAVAYDGLDCYDAVSRSFNYIYTKPWWMGFYTVLATFYGSLCYLFVRFYAFMLIWVTRSFLRFGVWRNNSEGVNKLVAIWPEPHFGALFGSNAPTPATQLESLAAFLIYLFLLMVVGTVVSFIISFYFSANTIIYALMRYKVDETPLANISRHHEDVVNHANMSE